jgi:uroporphyrinogen decarboxylase
MNSYQRVVAAVSRQEPDRVPVLLLMTLQGAKELDLPLPEYLRTPAAVAEGQARLLARYGHDCVYAFTYGAAEAEAFGGKVRWYDNSPPVVSKPMVTDPSDVLRLSAPDPESCEPLARTLEVIRLLAARFKGEAPIIANVIGPFSLPIMLMGMEGWLRLLLFGDVELRDRMLAVCQEFCVKWVNAQFAAGADAVGYFDPMSSTDLTTPAQFHEFGLPALRAIASQATGPLVLATAGGRSARIAVEAAEAGAAGLVVSSADDLAALKQRAVGKIALLGNLNNIAMASWRPQDAEREVKRCLAAGAPGGGFLLCDQHGELPWETSPEVLSTVVEAAHRWGRYPLDESLVSP